MAFALTLGARHSLSPTSRQGLSRRGRLRVMLRTVRLLPLSQGFRRWASTPGVSPRPRQPATGPPDSYPDRTFTGKRQRAYD